MKTVPPPSDQLIGYLAEYDLKVGELALALREIILSEAPDAIETVFKSYALAPNYSFTGKWTQAFCYIGVYARHVNLGFIRGVDLPDPEGLLVGEGKQLRHIKITTLEELKKRHVRGFIRAAIKNAKADFKSAKAASPAKASKSKRKPAGRNARLVGTGKKSNRDLR